MHGRICQGSHKIACPGPYMLVNAAVDWMNCPATGSLILWRWWRWGN